MTFPLVRVLGASPRPGLTIFNAPRPLPGAEQWTGPFVCGEHYSVVDLTLPGADRVLEEMAALKAVVLRYVSVEECRAKVVEARGTVSTHLTATEEQVIRTAMTLWYRLCETVEVNP